MPIVTVEMKGFSKFLRKLAPKAAAAVRKGVLSGAQRCIPLLQRRAENAPAASPNGRRGAVNTGYYRLRFRARATPTGAEVVNDAPYAGVIDGGRRPGKAMPNPRVIEKWARRRLGLSAQEAKRAAYPIARAIAKRGLRGRRVMKDAQREIERIIADEARRSLEENLLR